MGDAESVNNLKKKLKILEIICLILGTFFLLLSFIFYKMIALVLIFFSILAAFEWQKYQAKQVRNRMVDWDKSKYYWSDDNLSRNYTRFLKVFWPWMISKNYLTELGKEKLNINNLTDGDEVILSKHYFNEEGNEFMKNYYNRLTELVLEEKINFEQAIKKVSS